MADAEELAMLRSSIERALAAGLAADKDASVLWDALRDVGWDGAFAATNGGSGASEALAVAMECGRAVTPLPVTSLVAGSAAATRHPAIPAGLGDDIVLCVPDFPAASWRGLAATLPDDAASRLLVVPALDLTSTVVSLATDTDSMRVWRTADLIPLARRVDGLDSTVPVWIVPIADDLVMGTVDDDAQPSESYHFLRDLMMLVCAGEAIGLLDRALATTVDYALGRTAFGRPIGSFQAVKHMLADIKVILESSLAVTTQAARQLDEGVGMASFSAAAAARHTCHKVIDGLQLCVQIHGGIGVTMDCDLHVLIRRATLLRFLYADPYSSARRIVTLYTDGGPRYG